MQLNIPKMEEDILASSLRRHGWLLEELIRDLRVAQNRLKEALDAIEGRDIDPAEIKIYLDSASNSLSVLRKKIPSKIA